MTKIPSTAGAYSCPIHGVMTMCSEDLWWQRLSAPTSQPSQISPSHFLVSHLNTLGPLILTPHLISRSPSLPAHISYDITSSTSESKRTNPGKTPCLTSQGYEAVWFTHPGQADNPRKKNLATHVFWVVGNIWQKPGPKPKKGKNIYIFFVEST